MDAKVSIKTKTKTMPVQNFFRYISFKSVSLKIIKIISRLIKFTFDIGIGIEIKIEFENQKMAIFYSLFFKNK